MKFLILKYIFCIEQVPSTKLTTWSNSQVDISLDNLSPATQKDKPLQPTMNQLYGQQSIPQQMSPGANYYGSNTGMQPVMYGGGMAMNMAGNQMGMSGSSVNMFSNGVPQVNLGSNASMINRGMMAPGQVNNMQQAGVVGGNQNFGRVMQFK